MTWTWRRHLTEAPVGAIQEVLGNLAAYPPDGLRPANRVVSRWEGGARSWTAHVRVEDTTPSADLLIKFILGGTTPDDRLSKAAREFANLTTAYDLFSGQRGMSVPRPVAFFPSHAAIAMSYCIGPSLTKYLSRTSFAYSSRRRRQHCEALAVQCAEWLRRLRMVEDSSVKSADVICAYFQSLQSRLSHCRTRGLLDDVTITRLANRYTDRFQSSLGSELVVGASHHDYGPHNMIVEDQGICVIDLGDWQVDLQAHDVGRFSVELTLLSGSRALARDRSFIVNVRDTFLAACDIDASGPAIGLCATNSALGLLLTADEMLRMHPRNRWQSFVRRFLQTWLDCHGRSGQI